jgi:glycosyltransferase involved in cell wall biosynthesis
MNVANGFWLPFLRVRRVPTVVNVDGIEWERAKWGRFAKSTFRGGARATARFATRIVYDSKEIGRRWAAEFGTDGEFIPYGGDVPPTLPIEPGLVHRGYVLYVARFVPENSFEEFLESAEDLSQRWPVVLVGSSGFQNELDARVAQLAASTPNVTWLGHVADDNRLHSLWQHAGVYFHGHSVGGTNPALVQAMACGAPIVARDTAYNTEVLGSDGCFTSSEPDSIRCALDAMMSDSDRQREGSLRAESRALASYSWESVCASYAQLLGTVAGGQTSL